MGMRIGYHVDVDREGAVKHHDIMLSITSDVASWGRLRADMDMHIAYMNNNLHILLRRVITGVTLAVVFVGRGSRAQ